MSESIHYFPSEVIEEECTKGGVVGTYLLNDVDGDTMSRESQQQWEGRWTCGGGEGGGEGEDILEKVGQTIPRGPVGWGDGGGGTRHVGCGRGTAYIRQGRRIIRTAKQLPTKLTFLTLWFTVQ